MRETFEKYVRKITEKEWSKVDEKLKDRIRFAAICILCITSLCMLFVPGALLLPEEPEYSYMQGIGGEGYGDGKQDITYSQEFAPRYRKIKEIQLDIDKNGIGDEGFLRWNITDKKGNIVSEGSIPYDEVNDKRYTDIELNINVKYRQRYHMNVSFDQVNGVYPRLLLNHGEEQIEEGRRLFINGECFDNMNFVWGIMYGDVIPLRYVVTVWAFSIAAVVAFCLKDKWKTWMKIIMAFVALIMVPKYIVYYNECIINGPDSWFSEATFSSNCMIWYIVTLGLLLLSQSPKWTLRLSSIGVSILYVADFLCCGSGGTTMKIWDIMAAGTAKEVAGNYTYKISVDILVLVTFLLFVWSISYSFPKWRGKFRYRMIVGAAGVIYCLMAYNNMMTRDFWDTLEGVNCSTSFTMEYCYMKSGYVASLLSQIKANRGEKPEDYKRREAEKILAEVEGDDRAEGNKPHIIVIVNESLADLTTLGYEPMEEPLKYMKSLQSNTIKGYINVSVLGGGTSNSEFEFLTGNSMAYLPRGMYQFNVMNKREESILWHLRDLGYTTYAMHPALDSNWNRKTVYPLLGFQNYYWIEEFENAEERHGGVSDRETYQKIIEIYEDREPGEAQFIYDMTIQNHGGYDEIDVEEVIEDEYPTVSEYLSLMRYSDRDLEEVIEYFSRQKEDVLLCIFGDHQPDLEDKFYEDIFEGNGKSEQENLLNQYKTPFWIWANYDIEEKENIETSLNYLGGLLLETAGLPKSSYLQYVSEIRTEYPVLTINGYKDKDGISYTLEELPDKLKEYQKVQYYHLYDK